MKDRVLLAIDEEMALLKADIEKHPDPRYAKLKRLQDARVQYVGGEGDLPMPSNRTPPTNRFYGGGTPVMSRRAKSPATLSILQAIREISETEGRPMGATELFRRLEAKGITVPGTVPANNLSAMLSNSDDFQSHGRGHGWSLTGKEMDTKTTRPDMFPVQPSQAAE